MPQGEDGAQADGIGGCDTIISPSAWRGLHRGQPTQGLQRAWVTTQGQGVSTAVGPGSAGVLPGGTTATSPVAALLCPEGTGALWWWRWARSPTRCAWRDAYHRTRPASPEAKRGHTLIYDHASDTMRGSSERIHRGTPGNYASR